MADSKDKIVNEDLLKRLPKGLFEKVILKKGATKLDRDATKAWIEKELFEKHLSNEDFASAVYYKFPVDWPLHTKNPDSLQGNNGSLSPYQASFVYLDVGAWVGTKDPNKPKNWGNQTGYPMRDFGIVCGPLVALCTFRYAFSGDHCELWKKNRTLQQEPWKSVAALIEALSKSSGGDDQELGEAIVREAMLAQGSSRWIRHPEQCIIHVIMGDMHIPVLDEEIQTYGGSRQVNDPTPPLPSSFGQGQAQPFVLHTPDGDKTLKPPVPVRNAFEPVHEKPGLVPRLGRLDLGTMEGLVKKLVGPDEEHGTDGPKKVIEFAKTIDPITGIASLPVTLPVVAGTAIPAYLHGNPDVAKGLMTLQEAKQWYKYYREGVDNGRPADIFEEAGEHLFHFVARLENYEKPRKEGSLLSVKFLQLGDMMDFWVGFTCHYKPSDHPDLPVQTADEQGRRMLQAWTANLFQNTKQGRRVADAVDTLNLKGFYPTFLYGNHDNYLGGSGKLSYINGDGITVDLPQREAFYSNFGVFMEHGHQWESSNADNASAFLPLAGTLCPLGAWVTQAAFIRPGPIRQFEGKAAGLVAQMSGTFGQRMDQIIGSAVRYWRQSGDFYCYVMGHTHSACLTRVIVSSGHEEEVRKFVQKERNNSRIRVAIRTPSSEGQVIVYEEDNLGAQEGDVFVLREGYTPMPSIELYWWGASTIGSEWAALEDLYKPPAKSPEEVPENLRGPTGRKDFGGLSMKNVPPGVYEARLSLDLVRGPFRKSSMLDTSLWSNNIPVCKRLAVCGISIEEAANEEQPFVFYFDPAKGFSRPIFLRFAYYPQNNDQQNAWFALHRSGSADFRALRRAPVPHPVHRFLDHNMRFSLQISGQNTQQAGGFAGWVRPDQKPSFLPMWGRICISRLHPKHWDLTEPNKQPVGDWTISAFSEQGEPMGSASFSVKRPQPHGKK